MTTPLTQKELCPPIPDFLLVQNRVEPDPAKQAALREAWGKSKRADPNSGRTDFRKPASMPWSEWDAHLAREAEEKKRETDARIARMLEKKGLPVPAPKKGRVPRLRPKITAE
jgi:hypothetical protein